MGFFSFKTSDTKESIPNIYSHRVPFIVHMITEDGRHWKEPMYEGYGTFGGKGIYQLIAEMNNLKRDDEAIELLHESWIVSNDGKYRYKQGLIKGADFFNWEKDLIHDGKSANTLIRENLFHVEYPNGYNDWTKAAAKGIKLPKLVRNLPGTQNWKKVWDKLPYPENCVFQGYFYPKEDYENLNEE